MKHPIEGFCQCGQVSYKLNEPPKMEFASHRTECQKLATGPFSVTATVKSEAIEFSGELKEWKRSADSANINSAKFRADCGNRVYHFNPDDLSTIKLKLKPVNMADDRRFEPTAHLWACEKLSWY